MWLEVDRYNPTGYYEVNNIVLCCYFCNNDKSDIFNGDDYKKFMRDRFKFLRNLLPLFLLFFYSCNSINNDVLSEAQAKEIVQSKIKEESNGLVELLDFKKIDGVKKEILGQKAYYMSYHIKIICKENVHQLFSVYKNFNFYSDKDMQQKLHPPSMWLKSDFIDYKKGDIIEYDNQNLFTNTEKGWNY